jgi:small subunit ribosomal protein S13
MPRVAGVELPGNKKAWVALTYIYGIGRTLSRKILDTVGIDPERRMGELNEEELSRITTELQNYKIEGELRREVQENIKRLIAIKCYRGLRHLRNLPCHGQRTRTNARTRRGKRKTVGAVTAKTKKLLAKAKTEKKQ